MNPNRYDLILLFAVVSGIYYVIDETLNNAPPRRTAETLPVVFSVDASPNTAAGLRARWTLHCSTASFGPVPYQVQAVPAWR